MGEVTPFQRQVLDAASRKEHEQQERKREEMQQQGPGGGSPGPSRPTNPRSNGVGKNPGGGGTSDLGQQETVRYVNRSENPDHPVHDRDPDDLTDE